MFDSPVGRNTAVVSSAASPISIAWDPLTGAATIICRVCGSITFGNIRRGAVAKIDILHERDCRVVEGVDG
jgi:hypothetical protein